MRLALHSGEAELRDGDYYGSAINRRARLRDAAHGGQVILSGVTASLARERLPERAGLRSLGRHRLRDLHEPDEIFQLTHPHLPADFPPLRSDVRCTVGIASTRAGSSSVAAAHAGRERPGVAIVAALTGVQVRALRVAVQRVANDLRSQRARATVITGAVEWPWHASPESYNN